MAPSPNFYYFVAFAVAWMLLEIGAPPSGRPSRSRRPPSRCTAIWARRSPGQPATRPDSGPHPRGGGDGGVRAAAVVGVPGAGWTRCGARLADPSPGHAPAGGDILATIHARYLARLDVAAVNDAADVALTTATPTSSTTRIIINGSTSPRQRMRTSPSDPGDDRRASFSKRGPHGHARGHRSGAGAWCDGRREPCPMEEAQGLAGNCPHVGCRDPARGLGGRVDRAQRHQRGQPRAVPCGSSAHFIACQRVRRWPGVGVRQGSATIARTADSNGGGLTRGRRPTAASRQAETTSRSHCRASTGTP
jgi:hypothetical protein